MDAQRLSTTISMACVATTRHADELRDLDAALGDGDLGITVSKGSDAIVEALAALDAGSSPAEVVQACAKAFANANPSTMAALVAGALLHGSRAWGDAAEIDMRLAAELVRVAGESIAKRGKTQLGDKTILDALVPAGEAIGAASSADEAVGAAIAAAERAVADTKAMQSRRGRASWLQERSIGLQDPGATALLRFLQSWQEAMR